MRSLRPVLALLLALASPAAAQTLDQQQQWTESSQRLTDDARTDLWQTFVAGHNGQLTSVDLELHSCCEVGNTHPFGPVHVEIVTTEGGVPTETVLGATTYPSDPRFYWQWVSVDLTAADVQVVAGTTYAIHVWTGPDDWALSFFEIGYTGGNLYGPGALFGGTPGNPIPHAPSADLGFRTYVIDYFCGDGSANEASEQCDDGNTVSDDGCSATCQTEYCGDGVTNDVDETCDDGNTLGDDGCSATCQLEYCGDGVTDDATETCDDGNTVSNDGCSSTCQVEGCGDGVVQASEQCDDVNTIAGDGCSATCRFEPSATTCQTAIAKGAQKYLAARLAALQSCRLALRAGKTLSVSDPAACPTETAAAKKIAKAAAQARKSVAGSAKPKCTDALVAVLDACADTVDALISADATAGCLRASGDAAVAESLAETFGSK